MLTTVKDAYEAIYTGRSYQHEMGLVDVVLDGKFGRAKAGRKAPPRRVLEVGCGPGLRLAVLRQMHGKYEVEGLDRDAQMLALAAKRNPGVPLHRDDMREFALDARFNAVLCLFGVIGYMADTAEMTSALTQMREHLAPGGVLLLEPWLTPDLARDRYLRTDTAERPGLEVMRMNFTRVVGNKSLLTVHYLIGDSHGIRHVEELRELTLFSDEEYRAALRNAGFGEVDLEAYGPQGRGLYVAQV